MDLTFSEEQSAVMPEAGRILGIDLGDVRTGIAVSDNGQLLANGVKTVQAKSRAALIELLAEQATAFAAVGIVMGNPVNMNGTVGQRSEKVRQFAELLRERVCLPVVLFDERCSTMAAHRILNLTDTRGKKRKAVVDTLSAQIILQNFLDARRAGGR